MFDVNVRSAQAHDAICGEAVFLLAKRIVGEVLVLRHDARRVVSAQSGALAVAGHGNGAAHVVSVDLLVLHPSAAMLIRKACEEEGA